MGLDFFIIGPVKKGQTLLQAIVDIKSRSYLSILFYVGAFHFFFINGSFQLFGI